MSGYSGFHAFYAVVMSFRKIFFFFLVTSLVFKYTVIYRLIKMYNLLSSWCFYELYISIVVYYL